MLRKTLFAFALAVCSVFGNNAYATVMIESSEFTMTSIANTIVYDFNSDPNLAFVTPTSKLIGIEGIYTFFPPAGQSGLQTLRSKLFIMDDVGVGFDVIVNMEDMDGTPSYATNYALKGLAFSATVLGELFADPDGVVNAALGGIATDLAQVEAFLASGGTIVTQLRLITNDAPGGGGGEIPEPASLLLWGAIGGAGFLARRRLLSKPA
jgi:hypothetical protein